MKARLLIVMGMMAAFASRNSEAGPWSIEPSVGLSTDFITNPLLLESGAQSEEHVAAIADVPVRYDTDELEIVLRPSGRLANSQGYSSLASNYAHFDTSLQYGDELNSAGLRGELARDSSLYFLGGLVNRIGVPRDTALTSADWTRSVNERLQVALDASWQRVRYEEPADFNGLLNYRYWSAGPTWSYALTERDTLKLIANYGAYQAENGSTQSASQSYQVGIVRELSEIWTVSASAGYSKSVNTEHTYFDYFGFLIPITEKANQDGTVYVATISRQGERFNFNGSASRALQPTGFAFLSRQDSYNIGGSYKHSDRWDFAASATWLRAINPQISQGLAQLNTTEITDRYLNTQLTANWHWTPQWTLSMTVTRIMQQSSPPNVSAASSGISLNLVRKFLRTQF